MNPVDAFRRYEDEDEDNPGFSNSEEHGDLWVAISGCDRRIESLDKRVAVADERQRMMLWIVVPILGFLVSVQLLCLGVLLR